jgi:hypothetical protein
VAEQIRIESLIPKPLPDLRRVSFTLRVSGLPAYGPEAGSHTIQFFDMPNREQGDEAEPATFGDERSPSPFPDVELNILDRQGNEVASTYIVEHKEANLDFTLHLRDAQPDTTYIARARMTLNGETIQVIETPFDLR